MVSQVHMLVEEAVYRLIICLIMGLKGGILWCRMV